MNNKIAVFNLLVRRTYTIISNSFPIALRYICSYIESPSSTTKHQSAAYWNHFFFSPHYIDQFHKRRIWGLCIQTYTSGYWRRNQHSFFPHSYARHFTGERAFENQCARPYFILFFLFFYEGGKKICRKIHQSRIRNWLFRHRVYACWRYTSFSYSKRFSAFFFLGSSRSKRKTKTRLQLVPRLSLVFDTNDLDASCVTL